MRLIDADHLKTWVLSWWERTEPTSEYIKGKDILDQIDRESSIDLVLCGECKYWQDNNNGYPHEECRWGKGETPDADDFCSYGERRE